MTFSEKLVRLRKINSLTQDEFAKSVGVSRQAVYKWECGQSYPEAMVLVKIKELFGVSIDNLLDESFEIDAPDRRKRIRRPKAASEPKTEKVQDNKDTSPAPAVAQKAEERPTNAANSVKDEEKKVGFFGRLFGRK